MNRQQAGALLQQLGAAMGLSDLCFDDSGNPLDDHPPLDSIIDASLKDQATSILKGRQPAAAGPTHTRLCF